MSGTKKIIAILFCVWCFQPLYAQDANPYRKGAVKHRLSIGPVISFYINNPQHTTNTQGQTGFCASYKAEILLDRKFNLLIGMEYLNEGLIFQGYYSAPGSTYLFDKTFAYTHDIRFQEVQIPIGFKRSFNLEKNSFYTPYILGGFGARLIFASYYVITNDSTGNVLYDGKGNMSFEHQALTQILNGKGQAITKGFNTFLQFGLGSQYNFRDTGKALFFEMIYKYGISRLHYEGYQNSNDLNIKDSNLTISFGYRF